VLFHDKRHPERMGPAEVEAFLNDLAVRQRVLDRDLPWLDRISTSSTSKSWCAMVKVARTADD
jgi:hypothetical protein